ncbi:hypothetical protein GCM10025789_01080 [Tessaracoccus lubricantis]|uniref:Glycoside hydrolase family 31 n=1 Tax=Tessaracoccus lubricantis TaxID=545543 RepID=A0ABP9EWY9_9ACTN
MTTVHHHPAGVGHPYAHSLDQLMPPTPVVGEPLRFGVTASRGCRAVDLEVEFTDGETVRTPMGRVDGADSDAASLAGGEGHLAAAQEAAMAADNGWVTGWDRVAARDGRYRFVPSDGEPTPWFDLSPATWTADDLGDLRVPGVAPTRVEWLVSRAGVHRARFGLPLGPREHVVGFGERFDAVDQRGRQLDAVVFEQYKAQSRHGRTYLPMPFAHVIDEDGGAWGFHVRTTRRTWFDVGVTLPDVLLVEVDLGWVRPGQRPTVDVGLWRGTPVSVLTAFLDEVGRAQELPPWVLRLWASGNEWNTQALVMAQMDRHRAEDIPVGAVVIEAWSDEEGFCVFRDATYQPGDGSPRSAADFTYPPDGAWPDPAGMVQELHRRGIKVLLWQIPLQKDEGVGPEAAAQAQALVDSGHVVREADGAPYRNRGWWFPRALMPDLSTPQGRAWWTEQRRWLVRDLDIDGFKTDGGEHAWGRELQHGDGRRGDEGNNAFPVHYAKAFGDLLRSEGKAPVTFSRAGFAGSQPHGVYWAGDEDSTWEAFQASMRAGITASACGIVYWGWDLAGFSGPVPEAELYARALGAATFCPIMQYHSEFNHHQPPLRDRTPWNVADQRDAPELVGLALRFAHLREALVPYLEGQARAAVETDRPLMRGLFFDFAGDPTIWAHPGQFLLGDHLLVHPITQSAQEWATYLPAGRWVDVWSGTEHPGGAVVTRRYAWGEVPVFARAEAWGELAEVFDVGR